MFRSYLISLGFAALLTATASAQSSKDDDDVGRPPVDPNTKARDFIYQYQLPFYRDFLGTVAYDMRQRGDDSKEARGANCYDLTRQEQFVTGLLNQVQSLKESFKDSEIKLAKSAAETLYGRYQDGSYFKFYCSGLKNDKGEVIVSFSKARQVLQDTSSQIQDLINEIKKNNGKN